MPGRRRILGVSDASEFGLGGGLSLLPMISRAAVLNVLRIRAGARIDPLNGRDLLGDVRWVFQVGFRQ